MERAEISRRLKAARWLRGGLDEKGRPAPLSPEDLAQREPLKRNGISANAITEIERLVKDARPMELREISSAMDLPEDWFGDVSEYATVDSAVGTGAFLTEALVDIQDRLSVIETVLAPNDPTADTYFTSRNVIAAVIQAMQEARASGEGHPGTPDAADATTGSSEVRTAGTSAVAPPPPS